MNVNAALIPAPNPVLPIYMVQDRKLYRKRPETFLEPVTWPSRPPAPYEDEADIPLVDPPLRTFLRSKQTSVHASITFNNKSGVDCRLLWINFQGEEVAYTVITKGEVKTYSTFFNHLWIARDARSGARLLIEGAGAVVGRAKPYEALITEPGPLPYSEERFGLWPEAAKAQIRTLLLCHHRLRYRPALDAPPQDPHPEAGGAKISGASLLGMITGIPKAICGLARGAAGWSHGGSPSGPVQDSDGGGDSGFHGPQCSPFQPLKTGLVVLPSPKSPAGAARPTGAAPNDSPLSLFFTPTGLDDGHHVEGAAAVAALHEAGAGLTLRFSTPSRAAAAAPVPAILAPLSPAVKSHPLSPWPADAAAAMDCDADLSDPAASSDAEPDLPPDLGSLPEHLVVEWIIPRALAPLRQNPDLGGLAAPDVGPVLLPSDPEPADAEPAAGPAAAVVPNSPQGGNHAQPLPANLDVAFAGLNWDVPE